MKLRVNSIITKYSKKEFCELIIYSFIFLFTLIIAGGNTANPDYNEYKYRYTYLVSGSHTAVLLYALQFVFNKIGFSYQVFRAIELFFGLFLLSRTIKRYSDNRIFPFVLYLIYPFLLDVVQVGNFVAYTIIIFSIKYLEEDWPKGGIKYSIAVLIASQFHILTLAYAIFLLVYVKNTKRLIYIAISIAIGLFATLRILSQFIYYIPIISSHASQIRYYLTFNDSYRNGAFTYGLLLIAFFAVYYYKVLIVKRNNIQCNNIIISETMIKLIALVLCFVPFILVNSEFVRLIRNMWILFYIALSYDIKCDNKKTNIYNGLFKISAILLSLFLFYKELSPTAYYFESVTRTVFLNNIFW